MQSRILSCALGVVVCALLSNEAEAHGGQYRGPEDVVPPGGGGSGGRTGRPSGPTGAPRTGGPRGPSAPIPSGPGTGGSTGPSGPRGGSPAGRTGGGIRLDADLTGWSYWWEFNKHDFIGLRDAVHRSNTSTGYEGFWKGRGTMSSNSNLLEPTRDQIQNDILPSLKKAIDSTEQRDIVSSCLIGMAKIGQNHPEFALADVFQPRLSRDNQEIRETAALVYGIAAIKQGDAIETLSDLALDNERGRKLRGGELGVRTRSFALYGLGLYASEHNDDKVKQQALTTLRKVLEDDRLRDRNLKVAAITGIGLLALDPRDTEQAAMLDDALDALLRYYERPLGAGQQLIQSHCPTAITRLLDPGSARADEFRQRFAEELDGKNRKRRSHDLARSCVLALGQLCEPRDDKRSRHAGYSELLEKTFANHKDAQTRNFSLLALGQIGGTKNRDFLLRMLRKGNNLEQPWAAIALGVQAHERYRAAEAQQLAADIDETVGDALLEELEKAKQPEFVGALGVALGLTRHRDAAPAMVRIMKRDLQKEVQAGYLCLGVALMRDDGSVEDIQEAMSVSERRSNLFVQAAIALGLLGDKSAAEELHKKLDEEDSNLATLAAIAEALGQIGDRRSVAPLKRALFDEGRGDLQRAFAAVALGAVADRAKLPWHSKISTNINYRAAVETLTNQVSGVLDLL
ncbi:MAG: HEAT repeat domain-containing protein [Planctomycetota bacterium]